MPCCFRTCAGSLRGWIAACWSRFQNTARRHGKQRFQAIDAQWLNSVSDANPLFAATLPNKFMAIVPASRAKALAQAVTDAVRQRPGPGQLRRATEYSMQHIEMPATAPIGANKFPTS